MTEEEKKVLKNNYWKNSYLKNPDADLNKDGILSWPELHSHKKKIIRGFEKKNFRLNFLIKSFKLTSFLLNLIFQSVVD